MNYDLPEPIPQRSDREEAQKDFSLATVSNEIDRRCSLYETQLRNGKGKKNGLTKLNKNLPNCARCSPQHENAKFKDFDDFTNFFTQKPQ